MDHIDQHHHPHFKSDDPMETMMMTSLTPPPPPPPPPRQMAKAVLPDFSGSYSSGSSYNDVVEAPNNPQSNHLISGATTSSHVSVLPINYSTSSPPPPFMNLPSTLPFPARTNNGYNNYNSSSSKNCSMAAMREMIFRMAVMQPVHIDPESVKPPKRRNVKISKDPQSVAARHRRERISERIRILQRLVPGGTKMDTASMLDEAIHYVKFLKTQLQSLENASSSSSASPNNNNININASITGIGFPVPMSTGTAAIINRNNNNNNNYLYNNLLPNHDLSCSSSSNMEKAAHYQILGTPPLLHHTHHQNVRHFGDARSSSIIN